MKTRQNEQGAVMLYIIIAVALVAALTAIMSRGSRTTESTLTDQQAKVAAQEIVEYGNALTNAAQKLRLRGCQDTQFDFSNEIWKTHGGSTIYTAGQNPNAISPTCSVFKPDGGAITPSVFSMTFMEPWSTIAAGNTAQGAGRILKIAIPGLGEENKQEVAYILNYVKLDVCLAINKILGVDNPSGKPPYTGTSGVAIAEYGNGSFSDGTPYTDPSSALAGKTAFCISSTTTPTAYQYNFMQIILAR